MRVHESELYRLRGGGVGAIFSSIYRALVPLASSIFKVGSKIVTSKSGQKVLKAAKRSAVQAGLDVAQDALRGENAVESMKKRGREAAVNLVSEISDAHRKATTPSKKGAAKGGKKTKQKKKTAPRMRGYRVGGGEVSVGGGGKKKGRGKKPKTKKKKASGKKKSVSSGRVKKKKRSVGKKKKAGSSTPRKKARAGRAKAKRITKDNFLRSLGLC